MEGREEERMRRDWTVHGPERAKIKGDPGWPRGGSRDWDAKELPAKRRTLTKGKRKKKKGGMDWVTQNKKQVPFTGIRLTVTYSKRMREKIRPRLKGGEKRERGRGKCWHKYRNTRNRGRRRGNDESGEKVRRKGGGK